jgi:hypothetical protein
MGIWHVQRTREVRAWVYVGKTEGRRLLLRLMHSLEGDNKMHLNTLPWDHVCQRFLT